MLVFPLLTLETIIGFKLTTFITEFSLVWGQSPEGRGGFGNIQEHRTHLGSKEDMKHWCRVFLGNPPLAATYTISVHTSRMGFAEQKTFQTKTLMCMYSLLGQNTLSEFPPPLFLPSEIHYIRSCSLWREAEVGLHDLRGFFQSHWFRVILWQVKDKADRAAWS